MEEKMKYYALKAILPYLLQQVGYFEWAGNEPRQDIFRAVWLHPNEVADQADDTSYDMFCLVFMDSILCGLPIRG